MDIEHNGGPGAALHDLAVALAALDADLARRLGVSSTDYVALKHVMAAGQPIGPAELGRLLGITSGSATALVDRLERAGHLRREPHPRDRRRQALTIGEPTRARIMSALEPLDAALTEEAGAFTPAERRAIVRFLGIAASRCARHRTGGP